MNQPQTRIIVVGAGHLGSLHGRKLALDERVRVVAVVDGVADKAAALAARHGAASATSFDALPRDIAAADAAIIATPTTTHLEMASRALDMGLHVLVEKPIANSAREGKRLVDLAQRHARVLQVGHCERFNPAVAAGLAVADAPRFIVAERLGPFTGRSTDVDVVLDLMIHDLDIVASLVSAPLAFVHAIGVPVLTDETDMASARLAFTDGTVAQLSAGRASFEAVRKLRLFTQQRYVSIDCVQRDVKCVRRLPPQAGSHWPQIVAEPIEVAQIDALEAQDRHFVDCVRRAVCGREAVTGEAAGREASCTPIVDGNAGVRALVLAEAVKDAMQPATGALAVG